LLEAQQNFVGWDGHVDCTSQATPFWGANVNTPFSTGGIGGVRESQTLRASVNAPTALLRSFGGGGGGARSCISHASRVRARAIRSAHPRSARAFRRAGLSMSSTSVGADSPYFGTLSVAAVGAADVSTSVIAQARHRIAPVGANGSHRRCRDRSWVLAHGCRARAFTFGAWLPSATS
jgi:hypothetical protein